MAFAGATDLTIHNSCWGGEASSLAWNEASLPKGGQAVKAFSLMGGFGLGPATASENALATIAAKDFATAIDALFVTLVDGAIAEDRALTEEEMALYRSAAAYAQANPTPFWLNPALTDAAFIAQLQQNLPPSAAFAPQSFGIGGVLQKAGFALVNRARNLLGQGLTSAFRDDLNPAVARFLGDVFVYLKDGARRDAIRQTITADLVAAGARRAMGEKLVIIGHSLGGVILYDLLSDRPADLPGDLVIDMLVTV